MNSLYSNLPVYRDCYSVMLEFAKMRSVLPRDTRYTIAQDVSRCLTDMMVTIYRANSSRSDKARLIAEMRRQAVELQIYFRLLSDMHQLGVQKAAFFMDKVESIGKQLAAWHKRSILNGAEPSPIAGGRPECVGSRSGAASQKVNPMNGRAVSMKSPSAAAKGARDGMATPRPPTSEGGRPERVPCAGNGNGTSLNNSGSNGNYWSSTPNSDNSNNAWNLNFNSSDHNTNNNNRNNGFPVRPVLGFTAAPAGAVPHRCLFEQKLLADLIVAYHDARRHKRTRFYQTHFEMNQERELVKLRGELLERRYKPRPSSCFIVHDPKMREVFAAHFRDRVVHHLFYNYTHEVFERTFIADSYSCIVGRGTHFGIARIKGHIRSCSQNWTRPCYVLKLDIKGYFMHIDRDILIGRCREILSKAVARHGEGVFGGVSAEFVDYLLEKICLLNPLVKCRVLGDRDEWKKLPKDKSLFCSQEGCGLPIGNLSSQLFSNIYLGMLDEFVKRELKVRHYGRYVDDVVIVGESKDYVKSLIEPIRTFLREKLHLELSENKTRVCNARHGVEFLGAFIRPYRTYVASHSLRRIRNHLRSVSPRMSMKRAQAVVNSSLGVLSHYDNYLVRKVMNYKSGLSRFGRFSDDGLRFYPDALSWCLFRLR